MAIRRKPEEEDAQPSRLLEVDASMTGTLSFKDPVNLQINGRFEGTLDTKGSLIIGPSAQVKATLRGEEITVGGTIEGPVVATRRLELLATARVNGKISTPKLVVQEGAVLHGLCEMLVEPASPPADDRQWMTVDELARYLEVESNTIREWAESGRLPGRQEAGQWRFERARVEVWLAQEKIR